MLTVFSTVIRCGLGSMMLIDGPGAVSVLDRASTEAAPYKALLQPSAVFLESGL